MATTPDTTALQKGALTPAQAEQTSTQTAVNLMETLLSTPSLPTGTAISPNVQQVASTDLMGTSGLSGTLAQAAQAGPTTPTATAGTAPTTTAGALPTAPSASQYAAGTVIGSLPTATAATGTVTAPMTAATDTVSTDATVKGQLAGLQSEV